MILARLIMFVLAVCFSSAVLAHSALIKADPGPRSVLKNTPKVLRLWFNEPIELLYSKIMIKREGDTKETVLKNLRHVDNQGSSIEVELPELASGTIKIRYKVLSVDGHVVDSDYAFVIKP